MIKQRMIFIFFAALVLMVTLSPISAYAASYFGTTSESSYLWANTSTGANTITSVSFESCSKDATVQFFETVSGKASYTGAAAASGSGSLSPPTGTNAIKLVSNDGGEIYLTGATTTNPNSPTIKFENSGNCGGGSSGGSDSGSGSGGGSGEVKCDACALLNCPGWGAYMGKLEEIKNAIPAEPNWKRVSETFRDTITPKIKADLSEVLGKAPDLPDIPKMPEILNFKGNAPEGKEDPGLGDSTFSNDDIKNGAEKIKEREDDSGGFNIDNPIETLPSQDEFKENIPKDPKPEAPAPPKEPENPAPEPEEPENTAPTPEEPENTAPTPKEPENTAPTPKEPENTAPTPKEPENTAPTPDQPSYDFPVPGGYERPDGVIGAPVPGGYDRPDGVIGAPIPGDTTDSAPIPGR